MQRKEGRKRESLCQVGERDAEGMGAILTLAFFEGFQHKGRLAAVFELMKCNLRTALTKYGAGRWDGFTAYASSL